MNNEHYELLLRYLDNNLDADDATRAINLLQSDHEARDFVRLVAEQAITVADVERVAHSRRGAAECRHGL